jgi:hypothetical protein
VVEAGEGGIPVEVVDSNVRPGVIGPVLFGVFRNISEETLGTVVLKVTFRDAAGSELGYNAEGRLIGLYVGRVDDIQAGGSDFFKFGIVSSYFTEPEIANFEIIMVGSLAE